MTGMSREDDVDLLVKGGAEIGRLRAKLYGSEKEGDNRTSRKDAEKLLERLEACRGKLGLRSKVRLRGAAEEVLYLCCPEWWFHDTAERDRTDTSVAEDLIARCSGHVVRYVLRDGDFTLSSDA